MPKKKFKRVFSIDGFSTCCNRPTFSAKEVMDRARESEKPSVIDINIIMRHKANKLICSKKYTHYCGTCGKLTHALSKTYSRYPTTLVDFHSLRTCPQWDHKVKLTTGRSHYRFLANGPGVISNQDRMWNVFNPKTGWLYACHKKDGLKKAKVTVRNITYLAHLSGPHPDDMKKEFVRRSVEARTFYTWPINIAEMLEKHPDKPLEDKNAYDLGYAFTCLRFPALSTLPACNWGPPPRKLRKFLTTEHRFTKVIRKLYNNPTKKVQQAILEPDKYDIGNIYLFCNTFKKEYVDKMLDAGLFAGSEFGRNMATFGWRQYILEENDVTKNMKRFIKAYGQKRLVNQMVRRAMDWRTGAPKKAFSDLHFLGDAIRQWAEIKASIPEYEMPRDRTVKAVHDKLAKDHRRLQHADLPILYTDDEWKLNGVRDDVVFSLPMRTHDLIAVGEDMHTCVGSYAKGAADKKYTIVIVHAADDGRRLACLQIDGNGKLGQAKGPRNNTLTFMLAERIMEWCNKHNIDYKNCYDIAAGNRNTEVGLDATIELPNWMPRAVAHEGELLPAPAVAAPAVAAPEQVVDSFGRVLDSFGVEQPF